MRPNEPLHPGLAPIPYDAVARVLQSAAMTARRSWNRHNCDTYHCLSRAWRAMAMPAPYTALTAAVRAQLHISRPGTNVMDFDDTPGITAQDVAELLNAAARTVAAHAELTGARPTRLAAAA